MASKPLFHTDPGIALNGGEAIVTVMSGRSDLVSVAIKIEGLGLSFTLTAQQAGALADALDEASHIGDNL